MDLERLKRKVAESETRQTFDTYHKAVIKKGQLLIARCVGDYFEARRSWIVCDDNKPRPFNVEDGSILLEIINTVLEFEWDKDRTGKSFRNFRHKGRPSFKVVAHNGSENDQERGWYPSPTFLFNVIDRGDAWCKQNKHTSLLVKQPSEIGIGDRAFKAFAKESVKYGDPETYDLAWTKTGFGADTIYSVEKAPRSNELTVEGPTTPEEQAYGRYDLRKVAAGTTADIILANLAMQIKVIDDDLGTDFLARLQEEAARIPRDNIAMIRDRLTEVASEPATVVRRKKVEKPKAVEVAPCADCGTPFPVTETKCPKCGVEYTLAEGM